MSKKKYDEFENDERQNETGENENEVNDNKIEVEVNNEKSAKDTEHKKESKDVSMEELLTKANAKIAELEVENKAIKDSYLRKAAEFENYKRRTDNEQMNLIKYAAESFIQQILPVYDDLERSLNHINEGSSAGSIKEGIKLVFDKFGKILESQGVKRIDAKGKQFDFNYHEALMQQTAEGVAPHTVLNVIEHGYLYKDKVIKHAKVIVSQESAGGETTGNAGNPANENEENNNGNEN